MNLKILPALITGIVALNSTNNAKPNADIKTGLNYPVDISVAIADLNNDSLKDLVLASPLGVQVFYNKGKTFSSSWIYKDNSKFYTLKVGVDIGDYNNDGLADIVYATPEGVRLLENTNQGFKDSGLIYKNQDSQYITGVDVKLEDLNKDNKLDIVYANSGVIKFLIQD